jgi:hypothetical protein
MFDAGVSVGTRNIDMPWYALTSGFGHRHHDQERRGLGVGGEELPAVDHPVVAVAHGRVVNSVGSAPACGSVIE